MPRALNYRKNRKCGFTVIEILITISIIGILSSYILPQVKSARVKAQVANTEEQLLQLRNAVEIMAGETKEWPGHQVVGFVDTATPNNEIWDLSTQSSGLVATDGLFPNWNGPYIPEIPVDAWGNDYFFDTDYDIGTSSNVWVAVIGSFGPNGDGQNVYDSDNVIQILAR